MSNVVFLFGAGASFGAGGILPDAPPLGNWLYDELKKCHPTTWGALPSSVRSGLSDDFEDGMGRIYEKYPQLIPDLMQEMAVYFVQFRPCQGRSLYCKLSNFISSRDLLGDVILSTLNYECTLEYSLLNGGIPFSYFPSDDQDGVPLWKLHGSCNMFCRGLQVGKGISYGRGVTFEGGIRALMDPEQVIEECLVRSGLSPVMCLYMEGKPLQVSPSLIDDLQSRWANEIRNTEAVFCIGVSPNPEDEHIWRPLADTQGKIFYVGEETNFREWSSTYRNGNDRFISETFHQGFPIIKKETLSYADK